MFLTNLIAKLKYHGKIPISILLRASTLATVTKCYIAFNKDGSCYLYPVPPLLLKHSGIWVARGRKGAFQCEEVKFTHFKYQYSDWDTLISPSKTVEFPFTYKKLNPTRRLKRNQEL